MLYVKLRQCCCYTSPHPVVVVHDDYMQQEDDFHSSSSPRRLSELSSSSSLSARDVSSASKHMHAPTTTSQGVGLGVAEKDAYADTRRSPARGRSTRGWTSKWFETIPSEGNLGEALVRQHTVVHEGTRLVPYVHQVAGHRFSEGKNGSLVDCNGKFYKPLPTGPRGVREVAFYERIFGKKVDGGDVAADTTTTSNQPASESASSRIVDPARRWTDTQLSAFVPTFHGVVQLVPGAGTRPIRYVVLQDQAFHFNKPSILDVKIGYQTWHPKDSTDEHRLKCASRDAESTSSRLGFKLCGMQVYMPSGGTYWRAGKPACKRLRIEEVEPALRHFVTNGGSLRSSDVLFGKRGLLAQLRELYSFFEAQSSYVFYSSSILVMFEGSAQPGDGKTSVSIRLVDFAHTYYTEESSLFDGGGGDPTSIDVNFLGGLKSFIGFLERLDEDGGSVELPVQNYS